MITMILTQCMFYILGLDNPQLLSTSPTISTSTVGHRSSSSSLPITPIRASYTSDICSGNLINTDSGKFISKFFFSEIKQFPNTINHYKVSLF